MASVFVSYRRGDAPGHAGRLYDRLVERFGEAKVFKDLDSLEPGADFVEVVEETIARCDSLVAVIGRNWLPAKQGGDPGLDDPNNWVRLEIGKALKRRIRVIPVLVQDAPMPSPADLPDDLKALTRRHAVELSEAAWTAQVSKLIDSLQRPLAGESAARKQPQAAPESSHRPVPHAGSEGEPVGSGPPATPVTSETAALSAPKPAVKRGRELTRVTHDDSVLGVAFSPDGKRIATASFDRSACLWDSDSGRELTRVTHDDSVLAVAFSPDGKRIATASFDRSACLWDSDSGRELTRVTHEGPVLAVAFSPDGKRIATASVDKSACLWDSDSGRELTRVTHDDSVLAVAFSPDGKRIATASVDKSACLWDSDSGRELTRVTHDDSVLAVAFSPDGKRIATASVDKSACLWDSDSGRELTRVTHDDSVLAVAFSPDGKRIATASVDKSACLWDSDSGRELTRVTHDDPVLAVAFSPDGKQIATASGGSRERQTEQGGVIATPLTSIGSPTNRYGYVTLSDTA